MSKGNVGGFDDGKGRRQSIIACESGSNTRDYVPLYHSSPDTVVNPSKLEDSCDNVAPAIRRIILKLSS
jgi:hypothetical protein